MTLSPAAGAAEAGEAAAGAEEAAAEAGEAVAEAAGTAFKGIVRNWFGIYKTGIVRMNKKPDCGRSCPAIW